MHQVPISQPSFLACLRYGKTPSQIFLVCPNSWYPKTGVTMASENPRDHCEVYSPAVSRFFPCMPLHLMKYTRSNFLSTPPISHTPILCQKIRHNLDPTSHIGSCFQSSIFRHFSRMFSSFLTHFSTFLTSFFIRFLSFSHILTAAKPHPSSTFSAEILAPRSTRPPAPPEIFPSDDPRPSTPR